MLKSCSLCDFSRNWLEYQKPRIKESSYVKYHNLLENYLIPELGGFSPEELSYSDIEAFCTKLLSEGGLNGDGLTPKTVSDTLSLLRQIFKYIRAHSKVLPPDIEDLKVKSNPLELRILTHEEQKKLLSYLLSKPDKYTIGILTSLYTGLRVGEICALRWEDISLSGRTLHVCRTMQRIHIYEENTSKTIIQLSSPKSPCSNRVIPIPHAILPQITDHHRTDTGYFLTNSDKKFIEPRGMQRNFNKILSKLDITGATYHTLRHTFATRCVEVGMDSKCLSEILGHSNITMTLNRYVHPTLEHKRESMDLL